MDSETSKSVEETKVKQENDGKIEDESTKKDEKEIGKESSVDAVPENKEENEVAAVKKEAEEPVVAKEEKVDIKEEKVEIETVEMITKRIRAQTAAKAAKEAAQAKIFKSKPTQVFSSATAVPTFPVIETELTPVDNLEVVECDEVDEKRKLQSRGRFVGMNRFTVDKRSPKSFRKMESIDPPVPKPDVSSVVFNLSNNMKVLGSSENAFIPGFDPTNQGTVSWNDLKLDIASGNNLNFPKRTPAVKGVVHTGNNWIPKRGASDGAVVDLSGDELSENRGVDLDDTELGSNIEDDGILDPEPTWPESSANAYFQPQGQLEGSSYWTDENYSSYGTGEWYPIYSELEEIRRQMKQLQKIPEQMKKVQREVQEIDKNVKVILKNVSKDPEEEPGRTQEVNPARHTDRLVSV